MNWPTAFFLTAFVIFGGAYAAFAFVCHTVAKMDKETAERLDRKIRDLTH